jgi:hypothetical protein
MPARRRKPRLTPRRRVLLVSGQAFEFGRRDVLSPRLACFRRSIFFVVGFVLRHLALLIAVKVARYREDSGRPLKYRSVERFE